MSAKSQAIQNASSNLSKYGLTLNTSLQQEVASLSAPKYRVAVVGRYEVGKTTLINKVFLGDDPILVTGKGLCTTAVVTEVGYGETPKMTVREWDFAAGDEEQRKAAVAESRDRVTQTIEHPTLENVREATVAAELNARVSLAKRVSRVTIEAPIAQLRQYTLLDTPGIDDPAPELLENTTYRIIPSADLAIVVVGCQQLDQRELGLIRKDLIDDGISRLMVLVSYQPMSDKSEENRKAILETIRSQLANIGREEVPVQMYCFDDSLEDLYNSALQIRLLITSFLGNNALAGREERVAAHLRRELETMLLENAARLKSSVMSEEEKQELARKIDGAVEEFNRQAKDLFAGLDEEIFSLKNHVRQRIDAVLSNVFGECRLSMKAQQSFAELQERVRSCEMTLRTKLNEALVSLQAEIRRMVKEVIERHNGELTQLYSCWGTALDSGLDVGNTFLTKIPPIALEILNILVLDALMPGGWIIALLGRLLGSKIGLNKYLTGAIVQGLLVEKVCKELDQAQVQLSSELARQVQENIDKALEQLREEIEANNRRQVETIRAAMNEPQEKRQEKTKLEAIQSMLQEQLKAL